MATFEYEALDVSGKNRRGVIMADTPKHARQNLRQQNLTPIRINNARDKAAPTLFKPKAPRLSSKELVLITRQIATLVSTSVPLEEALNAVSQQSEKEDTRRLVLSVRERVLEGWRFADALGEDKKSFSPLYRAVVAAGETSGDLGKVLNRLATMLEKDRAIRSKVLMALIYPAALAFVALSVVVGLMSFVVPKIISQFDDFDAQLPFVTRLVVGISEALQNYGVFMLVGVILLIVAGWYALQQPKLKNRFDKILLALPVLGKLIRAIEGARFGRTLATLFAGGAPLIDSLIGAQRTLGNSYIKDQLDITITMVSEGAGISQGLQRAKVLPPMMTHMVAAGEKSGELPALLDKTANHLEEESETVINVALRLLEPAIIVLMGLIVMVIVLSILMPTLQLNSLATGV